VLGLWDGDQLAGIVALRPVVAPDAALNPELLELLVPHIGRLRASLLKSSESIASPLWELLSTLGYRAEIDRKEIAYLVDAGSFQAAASPVSGCLRRAREADFDAVLYASRASLVEEGRPDAYEQDPEVFSRWVRQRLARARVLEWEGRVAFAAWVDVQRPEGWLIQGVYTWPEQRRRGLGEAGVSAICEEALAEGAQHVQLSVIEGNVPAVRLYERLGFRAFDQLRTVLFT
jgi:hypothetical protein